MGIYAKDTNDLLTVNGTAAGYVGVASNVDYRVGATVWLRGDALATKECVVTDLSGPNLVGLRFKLFQPGMWNEDSDLRKEVPTYGRSDVSAYTTLANSRIFQEAGIVPNLL